MKVKCSKCKAVAELGPPPDFSPVSNKWALRCAALLTQIVNGHSAKAPKCVIMNDAMTSATIKARHGTQRVAKSRRAKDRKDNELQAPSCLQCKTPMYLASIAPHPQFAGVEECSYSCRQCKRTTRRLAVQQA
jgi:hypothetical protein